MTVASVQVSGVDVENVVRLIREVRTQWAPPTRLKVSEFAEAEIIIPTGPFAGTRFSREFAPFQAGILDVFHEPGVQTAVVMGSSQWGKTLSATILCAYHIKHEPCRQLVVEPTVKPMAEDFATNRMEPLMRSSLAGVVATRRSKDGKNTTLEKTYPGGSLSIGGANSASSLAARDVRFLVLDEVDRYKSELKGEGSPIQIAMKRTTAYRDRKRIFMCSSPSVVGGPIHDWWGRGDRRRWFVPCPACGVFFAFEWRQVRWVNRDPTSARLHCPECDYGLDDADRVAVLSLGEWRAGQPDRLDSTIVSFHIWEAYSPLSSLTDIVRGFLAAREKQKAGDPTDMHTWQNTTLGEPRELGDVAVVGTEALLQRVEVYLEALPWRLACITMGVDVQDNRLEALVVGWAVGEESWLIDRLLIPGDTSQPEPWQRLSEVLDRRYLHASGHQLSIRATCIDSGGHRTQEVYRWALRHAARQVYAVIGRDGQRPLVSSPSPKRTGREERPVPLYTVGVDAAKLAWTTRLALDRPVPEGPGWVHLPAADWCDTELLEQLTSERQVTRMKSGVRVQVWRKVRAANEMLDCAVYALAALRLLNPQLAVMADKLRRAPRPEPVATGEVPASPATISAKPARRATRSNYLG